MIHAHKYLLSSSVQGPGRGGEGNSQTLPSGERQPHTKNPPDLQLRGKFHTGDTIKKEGRQGGRSQMLFQLRPDLASQLKRWVTASQTEGPACAKVLGKETKKSSTGLRAQRGVDTERAVPAQTLGFGQHLPGNKVSWGRKAFPFLEVPSAARVTNIYHWCTQ